MPTEPGRPIRIGIADKSPLIRSALKGVIAGDRRFEFVASACDGLQFLDLLERMRMDVGVIGWVMPQHDGPAVLEALRSRLEVPRIVIYTGDPEPSLPGRALALGAAAFVSKQEAPERLLDAIEAVAAGGTVFPTFAARPAGERPLDDLSPRERELLSALGSGKTNAELARALGLSVNTVKFHLRNLFDKLQVRNRAQAVQLWHESRRRGE